MIHAWFFNSMEPCNIDFMPLKQVFNLPSIRAEEKGVLVLALVSILLLSGLSYIWLHERGKNQDDPETNMVAVINIEGPILSSADSGRITGMINQAIHNESIKAVVVGIDSPGGSANQIEKIYLDLLILKEEKPLVAYTTTALSGGYYISVASDYILTNPTSMIGSIGVIGTGPSTLIPSDQVLESGPYKATGYSKLLFPFNLSHALNKFVLAVETGRGERLGMTSTEIKKAMIYLGSEALEKGMVDEIGSLQKALDTAATEANLESYHVVELFPGNYSISSTTSHWNGYGSSKLSIETLNRINTPPAVYHLYLPVRSSAPFMMEDVNQTEPHNQTTFDGGGQLLVDVSHGNKVSTWVLDTLLGELTLRNVTSGFMDEWDEERISRATCLIVASPDRPYSAEEVKKVEAFVDNGGQLIFFYDPAAEFVEVPALHGPINSIASNFGVYYSKGYLYNQEENYGMYRNIYIRDVDENNLTSNLSNIVMFTSAPIKTIHGVARTSPDTYSSTAEMSGTYTTIARNTNGTVIAFGDLSFLMEPYCYVEDNYQLIINIADEISAEQREITDDVTEEDDVLEDPDLPVGTEKTFRETVNGEQDTLKWRKESETQVSAERPNSTTIYQYDEDGSLLGWENERMRLEYHEPIPKPPYPLEKGNNWEYEGTYDLVIEGEPYQGNLESRESVSSFMEVEALDGITYPCAEIEFSIEDTLNREGREISIIVNGLSWVSSEVGLVKEESNIKTYLDGILVSEENREKLLENSLTP
ncbi:hypothetical protein GF319_01965 [Candidatus Bathyarchaeota archaeon]|nr:hypothetical protein [Candidatus Bathyarchaeota archaeon]